LYRGVTPRIGLGVWQTICMVALGDMWVSGLCRARFLSTEFHDRLCPLTWSSTSAIPSRFSYPQMSGVELYWQRYFLQG
jgi:hypothetical protein